MKKSVPITQRAKSSPLKVDLGLIQGAATLGMSKVKGDAAAQFKPVSQPSTILSNPPIDEEEKPEDITLEIPKTSEELGLEEEEEDFDFKNDI